MTSAATDVTYGDVRLGTIGRRTGWRSWSTRGSGTSTSIGSSRMTLAMII